MHDLLSRHVNEASYAARHSGNRNRTTGKTGRYRQVDRCRVSGSSHLVEVLDLGEQALTGVFPRQAEAPVTTGPLRLVLCPESGLLQLAHSYGAEEMYGQNYGYRSGLNRSMVEHLTQKIHRLERWADLKPGDTVLDIGSNDATSLKAYRTAGLKRVGIDPTGNKFRQFYPDDIALVPDFFSAEVYRRTGGAPARIVTSIAMFYDLEDPVEFARQVASVLAADGVWHFEQSYMPAMLRLGAYDTICHEHLEYYSLGVVQGILGAAGMRIIDVTMNAVNGGSFAVTAVRHSDPRRGAEAMIAWLLEQEERMGLNTLRPYRAFEQRAHSHRTDLRRLLEMLKADGKTVVGYGASTKGNVVLQFCGIGPDLLPCIAEVNDEKFGAFTPGTGIPIVAESEVRAMAPDYLLVLPWHFRDGIVRREAEYLAGGGRLIFPFPEIEIV
jgi:hypothetical protein